jgi:[CysO sulfur-carrier protein]-S-L-cysteine hydrolase
MNYVPEARRPVQAERARIPDAADPRSPMLAPERWCRDHYPRSCVLHDRFRDDPFVDCVQRLPNERSQHRYPCLHAIVIGICVGNMSAGSLDRRMRIAPSLYDEMVAHAREEAPNECCGMVASRDGEAVRIYRAANAAASPLRYEIDGAEQYRIQMAIDDADLDLGAIYHSHTRSRPYPSQTDINLAFYPEALYLIVGLAGGEPEVRAFTIRDGNVAEAELVVE